MQKRRGRAPRREKGDKPKNVKQVMMAVTYTLKREERLRFGPLHWRMQASLGKKRHAFECALQEAARHGLGEGTDKTVQILTDREPTLHLYTEETFEATGFPNRVVAVDAVGALEKLWDAGQARHREGSTALAARVRLQENLAAPRQGRLGARRASHLAGLGANRRDRATRAVRSGHRTPFATWIGDSTRSTTGSTGRKGARSGGRHRASRGRHRGRHRQAVRSWRHAVDPTAGPGCHPATPHRRKRALAPVRPQDSGPPANRRAGRRQTCAASDEHTGKPATCCPCCVTEADLHPLELPRPPRGGDRPNDWADVASRPGGERPAAPSQPPMPQSQPPTSPCLLSCAPARSPWWVG